jgi:spermidine synthase
VAGVGLRGSVRAEVDLGTAELVPDAGRAQAWTLYVDGVEQSYVDLTDPRRLEFEYVRRIATVVDAAAPPGAPLRVLHLGGGAMTLPRYVAATRPGSVQDVVERDARLVALVERVLPAPAAQVRIVDAVSFVRDAAAAGCGGRA